MRRISFSLPWRTAVAAGVLVAALATGPAASAVMITTSVGTDVTVAGNLTVYGTTSLGAALADGVTVNGAIQGANALVFEGATVDGNKTTLAITDPTGARTITLPDLSGTVVLDTAGQTLTNKTLTAPVISTISNTGTLTLPTSTDTLVGRATTDTLTNKTLTSPKIDTSILDTNGNTMLSFAATGSAVNYLELANGSTGISPFFTAMGSDTDIGAMFSLKGAGHLAITASPANSDEIDIFPNTAGAAWHPGNLTTEDLTTARTWTLPDATGTITVLGNATTGTGSIVLATAPAFSGDLTADTDTLSVDSADHRVGVGTTTPTEKLDVFGGGSLTDIAVGSTVSANASAPAGILFYGNDSAATPITYGAIAAIIDDNTHNSALGKLSFLTQNFGSLSSRMTLDAVGNLVLDGSVSVGGHVKSTGPSASAGTDTCGGTTVVTGTDTRGTVSNDAAGCTAGQTLVVHFGTAYGTAPICAISPANAVAALNSTGLATVTATTTDMTVTLNTATGAATGTWNYICIE